MEVDMLAIAPEPDIPDEAFEEATIGCERWTGEKVKELIGEMRAKILELKDLLRDETKRANRAEAEARECQVRLSRDGLTAIEVLRRMYQGVDAFDQARFKCAVEALQFELPKKTETTARSANFNLSYSMETNLRTIEEAHQRALEAHNLKVVK
jgi:hypothetical protein